MSANNRDWSVEAEQRETDFAEHVDSVLHPAWPGEAFDNPIGRQPSFTDITARVRQAQSRNHDIDPAKAVAIQ
jgi:hypothetical protein